MTGTEERFRPWWVQRLGWGLLHLLWRGSAAAGLPARVRRIIGLPDRHSGRGAPWLAGMLIIASVIASGLIICGSAASGQAPQAAGPPAPGGAGTQPASSSAGDREFDRLWDEIGRGDYQVASAAVRELSLGGDRAVAFMRARLKLPQAGPERIEKLIADLNSEEYAVRKKATERLALLGPLAEAALRKALAARPSPEARARIEALLKGLSGTFISREAWRVLRTMRVLERIGTPAARKFLQELKASEIIPHLRYYQGEGYALLAGFAPDKARCILGEPVFITFLVRNLSNKPYVFYTGGASRGSVRDNNFRITAADAAGKPVKDPHSYEHFGGFGGEVKLTLGQVYTNRLFLGHWCAFDRPGKYKVTCRRTLNEGSRNLTVIAAEAGFSFEVLPADAEQLREIIAGLGRKLGAGDKQSLYEATLALSAIQDEQVIPHLAASLKSAEWQHKGMAVQALSRFSTDAAAEALCVAMKDPDHSLGAAAGQALKGMNKTDYAVDRLLVEFKKGTGADRAAVARALGWTRSRRTTKALVAAVADEDAAVRAAAAEAIGELGDWGQIETLKRCLKDEDMGLRVAAVKGLRALDQPVQAEWLTPVIRAVVDLNDQSFHEAIRLLRLYGKDQAARGLVSCLHFDNPLVNHGYNMFLILAIEAAKGGPKYYSKYHHDLNTKGTPEQIDQNRQVLAALKSWLAEQEKIKRPELPAEVKQALAEAMKIRIRHPDGGLAMWQELAALVRPGWTVQQMKMILPSPGGGGLSHSEGRVTVGYAVQRNAFMVSAEGKYVAGASFEKRDGDDKIVLTAVPRIRTLRPATRPAGSSQATRPASTGSGPASPPQTQPAPGGRAQVETQKIIQQMRGLSMQREPPRSDGRPNPTELRRDEIYAELRTVGEAAVPALAGALEDQDVQMRRNAALVLIELAGSWTGKPPMDIRTALPALIRALQDSDHYVRAWAAHALAEMRADAQAAIPALVKMLKDPEPGPRHNSAMALAAMGAKAEVAVPTLVEALADEESDVRGMAATALGAVGPAAKPALPALRRASKDPNWRVQDAAVKAIKKIEARAPPAAGAAACERAGTTRPASTGSGPAGSSQATPPASTGSGQASSSQAPSSGARPSNAGDGRISQLIERLGSDSYRQRQAAQEALVRIGPAALPALGKAAADEDPERARRAKATIEQIAENAEAKRLELRGLIAQAVGTDGHAATRHYKALLALPQPPLCDCRNAMKFFEGRQDWAGLAAAMHAAAGSMKRVIQTPVEKFIGPPVQPQPGVREGGPLVWVQSDLDGLWVKGKGGPEAWLPRLRRIQKELVGDRFYLLFKLGRLYRAKLDEPKKAAAAFAESLADLDFCTEPIEKVIADNWPVRSGKVREAWGSMGYLGSMKELAEAQELCEDLPAAIDTKTRELLGHFCVGWNVRDGLTSRCARQLWAMICKLPPERPLPPLFWFNVLSPDRPEITFDLAKSEKPRDAADVYDLNVVARPGFVFDTLQVAADMESRGGQGQVRCYTVFQKVTTIGALRWPAEEEKGRQRISSTFTVPKGAGIIRLYKYPRNAKDFQVHRITVKASFKPRPVGSASTPAGPPP